MQGTKIKKFYWIYTCPYCSASAKDELEVSTRMCGNCGRKYKVEDNE